MSSLHRLVKKIAGVSHEVLIQRAIKGDIDGHALLLPPAGSSCLLSEGGNGACKTNLALRSSIQTADMMFEFIQTPDLEARMGDDPGA